MEPALFNVFVNNMNSGIKCTPGKFANDIEELCGVVITLEGKDGIWRDLDRSERWIFNEVQQGEV